MSNGSSTCFLAVSDPQQVAAQARSLNAGGTGQLLVLVAEGGSPDLDAIRRSLNEYGLSFFGGLFPEVIALGRRQPQGVLLVNLPALGAAIVFSDLENASSGLAELAASIPADRAVPATAFVLVDGLSPHISRFLEAAYNELGNRVRYWGGGAGSKSLKQRPCLFAPEGVFQGGAIIALSSLEASLGVRHGWSVYKQPLVATRTRGNVIQQLNWRNALEVYSDQIAEDLKAPVNAHNIADIRRNYPFGIKKQGEELVVRDPVALTKDGGLCCVGDVPENAVLAILKGNPDELIEAARKAAIDAVPVGRKRIHSCLLADCVTRVMYLGERFQDELDAIRSGLGSIAETAPSGGVLTLGEISSRGDGYLELFNKTCVVAVLHEP
ncbi:MAG: FIST C-terminal domain-containing protein [Pseudomonadota bacterium]